MTGKTFRFHVIGVIVFVVVTSALSLWASYTWTNYGKGFRAIPPVLIPIGGAWLAFCWQRRVAFTKALFDVWQKLVVTVQDAIQYTHLAQPSQTDYAKVMHALSCRIDDVRGAFRNVGDRHRMTEEDKKFILAIKGAKTLNDCAIELKKYPGIDRSIIGVYPFESLKQIQSVIEKLGFGQKVTPEQSLIARRAINSLCQILRGELLKELERDLPEYPDTPYGK